MATVEAAAAAVATLAAGWVAGATAAARAPRRRGRRQAEWHDGGGKAPIGGQLRRMTLLEKICTQVLRRLTLRKRVLH